MTLDAFVAQVVNGAASAASLFLVAAGLSLIFGVTRIVNFAHGSLAMLGAYIGYSLVAKLGASVLGYWSAVALAALVVGAIGLLLEALLLRRLYDAPEMLQLTATFGVVLVIADATLAIWGPEDRLGPRAPGLRGALSIGGALVPQYDVLMMIASPIVLALLVVLLRATRWGVLVRAATEDREMTAALGVDERALFSSVFFLGAALAGLGGALALPREPANLGMDMSIIADAFVVTVIGGLGSIPGALVAALAVGIAKALCIGLGEVSLAGVDIAFPKLTGVVEFALMALVLVVRPWGLFGRPSRAAPLAARTIRRSLTRRFVLGSAVVLALLALLPLTGASYAVVLATDIVVFALFAASLGLLMGDGGMISFGHAAFFGLGAYTAALVARAVRMELALVAAPILCALAALAFALGARRLRGVYLAMLTLAFAQIVWSVAYQWDSLTGGSNGIVGVWPPSWVGTTSRYYELALACCATALFGLWHVTDAPLGASLRAARDSSARLEASGVSAPIVQRFAFVLAGASAGLAGALYAFSKGSISPETLAIPRSLDAIVMVLLGGVDTLVGPLVGAATLTLLQDTAARAFEYWRALVGVLVVSIVLVFPRGIVGTIGHAWRARRS